MTPELTDLRKITRNSRRCCTKVFLHLDRYDPPTPWLILGEANIAYHAKLDQYRLQAYLLNATDFEHDSAYAIWLPLVGLSVDEQPVYRGQTNFKAWVDGTNNEDFHVPRPGFNPIKHPNTMVCTECEVHHPIIPEGFYAGPPTDLELYQAVAGKKVSIRIGPVVPGEDP